MKPLPILAATALAGSFAVPAAAHPGHLADLAGHNHWIGLAAVGAALGAAAWAGLRGRRQPDEADKGEAADAPSDPAAARKA